MMPSRPQGMVAFTVVWMGQVVSLFGTGMASFALTLWAWKETGSATALALVGLFSFGPTVVVSPVAGALVDRWNRKLVMMLSDLAAGLSSIAVLALFLSGRLEIWHLFVTGAFAGIFGSFQWPAYSAAISVMLPKSQYVRASGMISLAESGSQILAPLAAGLLLGVIGIGGILAIDITTFLVAIMALLLVHIPQPAVTEAGLKSRGNLMQEAVYGFRYILERPSLLYLQLIFFGGNLFSGLTYTVLAPMILSRTGNDATILGSVLSASAVGGVAGSLIMSAWGGPKRRIHGILLGHAAAGLFGQTLMGMGRGPSTWIPAAVADGSTMSIINSCNQAIWQSKVEPDVQGRVFSVRRLIANLSLPMAMLLAGPLADRIFEPGMAAGTGWLASFTPVVGAGAGSGMGLMFVFSGLCVLCLALVGYSLPQVRHVETILPDRESLVQPEVLSRG